MFNELRIHHTREPLVTSLKCHLLHILASGRTAAEIEAAGLLVNAHRDGRPVVADNNCHSVSSRLIQSSVPAAEHNRAVGSRNCSGGVAPRTRRRAVATRNTSGGVQM